MLKIEKTKFYFFSDKGGVGKTTMAAASALYFADMGKRTLIVTTDPASNLADVFEQSIGHKITTIAGSLNLFNMAIADRWLLWGCQDGHFLYVTASLF